MSQKSSTPDNNSLALGEAIRRARASRHWTQADLAERLQVKRASVSLWETGQAPGPLNMAALRTVLGDALVEPLAPLTADERGYLRGRIEQIAEQMAQSLAQQRALVEHLRAGPYADTPRAVVATMQATESTADPKAAAPAVRRTKQG